MQRGQGPTSAGSTAGNIATRSWLRPSLRYGSMSTIPLARNTFATAAASTESVEVDGADDLRALAPGRRRTASCTRCVSAQPYSRSSGLGGALDAPVQAALAVEPVDLLGHQEERRQRRGVVGLVEPRVARPRSAGRGTPAPSGRTPRSPRSRSSAAGRHQRDPQPAVGGEALLRREVVDVGLAQVDRQAAGAGRRVDQHQRAAVGAGAPGARRPATPVEVSLCGQA